MKKGERGTLPPWESFGLCNLFLVNHDLSHVSHSKTLPAHYKIRACSFSPSDIEQVYHVLDMAFGIQHGEWSPERVKKELWDDNTVRKTFVIEYHNPDDGSTNIVACGSLRLHEKYPGKGYLHWVAVHPHHQGQGLATFIVSSVCHELHRDYCFKEAVLETQDTSFPAIVTYMRLGFHPTISDESHAERWKKIFPLIGMEPDFPLDTYTG
jgi:ribosomal protein S18 acetylase RimI-like enzyme